MDEASNTSPPKSFSDLMNPPGRKALQEELGAMLKRFEEAGADRGMIADILFYHCQLYLLPGDDMSTGDILGWLRRLQRYHDDIGQSRAMMEQLVHAIGGHG